MFFKKYPDAEFDIEGQTFIGIERKRGETVFVFPAGLEDVWLCCSPEKHQDFVNRFRRKLHIEHTKSMEESGD